VVFLTLTGKGKGKWKDRKTEIYRKVDWIQL
jgi:hypothetical protein